MRISNPTAFIAGLKESRALLADTDYYEKIRVSIQAIDPLEKNLSPRDKRRVEEERDNALWWLDKMRERALEEAKVTAG